MRKVISKLLLLALVAGICNAQAQAPSRPSGPPVRTQPQQNQPQAGAPARPNPNAPQRPNTNNVAPNGPARQQGPITRSPNTPTRPPTNTNNNAVNRPAQPNRPLPNPQQPQQGPVQRPNNAPTRATTAPLRPNPAPPAASVPRPNTQAPSRPNPAPPAANVPTPPGSGGGSGTTTPRTTTRRITDDEGHEVDMVNFPTAPTIAPTPDVIFVTPRLPGNPQHPNVPITPWNPRQNEGRPDNRCPLNQDSRNPTHLPHETDCGRFYKCDHGIAFEYRCPDGQHWNVRRNFCDFPANANCRTSGNQNINNGVPVVPLPPHSPQVPDWPNNNRNNWNNQNNNQNNWNNPNSNIVPWTNAPLNNNNPNPGFENPIIIPMAPRS